MKPYEIPAITTKQMREVDRLMVEVYRIKLVQMMENAGRNLAVLARDLFFDGDSAGKRVLVLAGSGGNGGGGLAAGRRLHNWGADVQVYITRPVDQITGVPGLQLESLIEMGVPLQDGRGVSSLPESDLILDAIIGYSLRGAPQGISAHLIDMANARSAEGVPILSLDIPSGMDASTGEVHLPCIQAAATLTLALPKTGLVKDQVSSTVGDLYLADISVPPGLYRSLGINLPPIFHRQEIINI